MTTSIIYTLADPRFTGAAAIRYISVTGDLYTRFALHLSSTGSNPEKDAWIKQLKAAHIMVCVLTLEIIVDDPHEARLREGYWILHYLHLGAQLLNKRMPANMPREAYEDDKEVWVHFLFREGCSITQIVWQVWAYCPR